MVAVGCGDWGPDDVEVWRQRVPGSSAVIYHVNASYNNTISGHFLQGLMFADSTAPFTNDYDYFRALTSYAAITGVRAGEVEFASWAGSGVSRPLDLSDDAYTRPVTSESFHIGGATFTNAHYRGRLSGRPCGLQRYNFLRFEEDADSLVIYDLTWKGRAPVPRKAFPKGNIKATLDSSGFVTKLDIEEFIVGIYPGYRTTSQPFELTNGPTTCTATYWLTHKGEERQIISDYGVFKPFWRCTSEEECPE